MTNLLLYLSSILLWFSALVQLGVDRKVAGIAILLWALHPNDAESVAWLAERKGRLAMTFAGATFLAYARFRAGRSRWWLLLASIAAICAVWSKAHGAFAVGALAALELLLPERRVSWKRSLVGLAVVGGAAMLAFVPVLLLARASSVVGSASGGGARLGTSLGTHGFYVQLAAMVRPTNG